MKKIDTRLIDILNRSNLIDRTLYFKSPTEAVIFCNDDGNEFFTVKVTDVSHNTEVCDSVKSIKNIIIDKMREFGFLEDNRVTAMSLGPIGLISFIDGPSFRMDIKETDEIPISTMMESDDLKSVTNPYIYKIMHFLVEAFKNDCRFSLYKDQFSDEYISSMKSSMFIKQGKCSTTYKIFCREKYYKVMFTEIQR